MTKTTDGSVARIRHEPDPLLTHLILAINTTAPNRVLPLTVFRQQPHPAEPADRTN